MQADILIGSPAEALVSNDSVILIIDDNPRSIKALSLLIRDFGQVIFATSGEAGIAMTMKTKPDLILLDVEMPGMNGYEVCRQLKGDVATRSSGIIIVTSHQEQSFLKKASQLGVSAFLTKPPKAREIERAITIALARHGDLQELRRLNTELKKALEEIKTLRGIIPICASCKKIRGDEGFWQQIENYISQHSEAAFTHGICPDCARKLYPDMVDEMDFS